MEVDLSPEEYFRHQAAAALLHSDEDALDDAKETWSDIDDASGAEEEDPVVLKKKRYLRYGRSRLADMQERFNAGKSRLFEARQHQLDLEWAQLKDGTHPRYREFVDQVDARWSDRLAKIEQKMESSCAFAETKLISSQTAATNTFVAGRAELRRAMIYRRKKHMWALTDELRNLEKIREAIVNIACPPSQLSAPRLIKPVAAGRRYSHHLLDVSGVPPPPAEDDSDLSAIFSIPSLLNHADADALLPEDASVDAVALSPALADAVADTRVPASLNEYAYHDVPNPRSALAAAERGEYYKYGDHAAAGNGYHKQAMAPVASSKSSYYDTAAAAAAAAAAEPAGTSDYVAHHASADHRYAGAAVTAAASSKISDLLHSSADSYAAYDSRNPGRQPPSAYYDSSRPHAHHQHHQHQHASSTMAPATTALGKHDIPADFDDAPTKRQRMVQPSTTWPSAAAPYASHAHPQQQYANGSSRSWTDLPSTAAAAAAAAGVDGYGGYYQKHTAPPTPGVNHGSSAYQPQYHQQPPSTGDHHAYHYNQPQQHYQQQQQHGYHHGQHHQHQQSASSAPYYGAPPPPPPPPPPAAKYDYANDGAYYQHHPSHQMSTAAATPAQHQHASAAHYRGGDSVYYQYPQGAAAPPPGGRASDPYYSYKQQPTGSNGAGWSDYYQQTQGNAGAHQYAQAGPAGQQHRYPQQQVGSSAAAAGAAPPSTLQHHGQEYYERSGGYYNGQHHGTSGNDSRHYSTTLPNFTK